MITDKNIIERINIELNNEFRRLDGKPFFRIVWSDDQYDIRRGKFSDFYGHIFIREVTQVRRIKKYWYFNKPAWVLERLIFIPQISALEEICSELIEARNGTYECIYRWADMQTEEPIHVDPVFAKAVIWQLLNPTKRLPSDMVEDMLRSEAAEIRHFEEELSQDERSPLFVWDNSAFVSTNQLEHKKKMTYKENVRPEEILLPR